MNNSIFCPACGSSDVTESHSTEFRQLTLGPEFEVNFSNFHCNVCGEEGDFALKNDTAVSCAVKEAQKVFIKHTLTEFDAVVPLVRIERALELPFRTLNRWKSGDFSSASIALLRILKTYPWIIDVADHKFSKASSKMNLLQAAAECLSSTLTESNLNMNISLENQPSAVTVRADISKREAPRMYSGQKIAAGG